MKKIGEGLSCSTKSDVTGELAYITTLEDVIELFDKFVYFERKKSKNYS